MQNHLRTTAQQRLTIAVSEEHKRGIRLNHAEPICFMQISLKSNSQVFKVSVTMKYYCQLGFSNTAELIPNNSLIKPFKDRQSGE